MKLSDYISERQIQIGIQADEKEGVLQELLSLLSQKGKITKNREKEVFSALMEREKLGSTGICQGVAIPHVKLGFIKTPKVVIGISSQGVDFDALDGGGVYIIFLLLSPDSSAGKHLNLMSQISKLLQDKFCLQKIKDVDKAREIKRIIKIYESKI